jgi:hypothetical protein
MSITGVIQYSDGLGECSALDAIASGGVTTGRLSNISQASIVHISSYSVTQNFTGLTLLTSFVPAANSSFSWVFVQARITSTLPLAYPEYINVRADYLNYSLSYPIYPAHNNQNGPFLRTFRFGKVDYDASTAPVVVYIGPSGTSPRNIEVKSTYIQIS